MEWTSPRKIAPTQAGGPAQRSLEALAARLRQATGDLIFHDSGARTGRRQIRGGRAPVRSILFLVAAFNSEHAR